MKHRYYCIIYIIVFLLCAPNAVGQHLWNTPQSFPKQEIRAVWLTTLSGLDWPSTKATSTANIAKQKEELITILDQLQVANINTILLQTRIRGTVIYPSAYEPWDVALTGQYGRHPGYDPLAFIIEEAHKRGMELHAWVVTIPAFKVANIKKMTAPNLYKTHPELLIKHGDTYYMDPALPGTTDYLQKICMEIVNNYDIDGLSFDYIRYPENASSFPDAQSYKKYGHGQNKADWRRDNITHIVRTLYNKVKAQKPWVKMSCSPVGKYRDTKRYSSKGWNCYDAVYQDAQGWLREGIQDILFPMMYFDGNHFYPFAADWAEQSHGRYVVPGLGIYFLHPHEKNWPLTTITRQLNYLRSEGLGGEAFYRNRFLTDNTKGLYNFVRDTYYAFPALPSPCTWIDSIAPSRPDGANIAKLSEELSDVTWLASHDNLSNDGITYCVYASDNYPVDIARVENMVAYRLRDRHYTFNHQLGKHLAITAIDRCGNESEALQLGNGIRRSGTTPSKHYLTHDGKLLQLPSIQDARSYIITDIAGRKCLTGRWTERVNIRSLQAGVYRLFYTEKQNKPRLVGEFKK